MSEAGEAMKGQRQQRGISNLPGWVSSLMGSTWPHGEAASPLRDPLFPCPLALTRYVALSKSHGLSGSQLSQPFTPSRPLLCS